MTGKGKKKKAPANGTSVPNGHAPNGDSAAQPHSAQELKAKALKADTQAQPPARPTNGHQRNGSAAEDALARDAQEEKPASSSSEPEPAAEPEDKEAAGEASGAARPEDVAGPSGRCGEVSIDAAVAESAEALRRLELGGGVRLTPYTGEHELGPIMALISRDLSEPYSIYTYRYFIHNWPHLCFLARAAPEESSGGKGRAVGVVVCKLDVSRRETRRGYVAMLAVDGSERRKGIGSRLVRRAIQAMRNCGCDEVVLETEVTNAASLRLYEALGFVRDKRLFRYYLNGVDAFRLKLWLAPPTLPFQFPFHYP